MAFLCLRPILCVCDPCDPWLSWYLTLVFFPATSVASFFFHTRITLTLMYLMVPLWPSMWMWITALQAHLRSNLVSTPTLSKTVSETNKTSHQLPQTVPSLLYPLHISTRLSPQICPVAAVCGVWHWTRPSCAVCGDGGSGRCLCAPWGPSLSFTRLLFLSLTLDFFETLECEMSVTVSGMAK